MPDMLDRPTTFGALKQHPSYGQTSRVHRTVKDEMRQNLMRKLQARETLFPGIIGYKETVIPQITNAILSKHNMVLLGLRGQAKSRILRGLIEYLDEDIPVIAGCEINDNPFAPICRYCRLRLEQDGDQTPITFLPREARYVEKLATPGRHHRRHHRRH